MSLLEGDFQGDRLQAERMALLIYKQVLEDPLVVQYRGVLCWAKAQIPSQDGRWLPRRRSVLSLCAC